VRRPLGVTWTGTLMTDGDAFAEATVAVADAEANKAMSIGGLPEVEATVVAVEAVGGLPFDADGESDWSSSLRTLEMTR
jgi:hypothetical protein